MEILSQAATWYPILKLLKMLNSAYSYTLRLQILYSGESSTISFSPHKMHQFNVSLLEGLRFCMHTIYVSCQSMEPVEKVVLVGRFCVNERRRFLEQR